MGLARHVVSDEPYSAGNLVGHDELLDVTDATDTTAGGAAGPQWRNLPWVAIATAAITLLGVVMLVGGGFRAVIGAWLLAIASPLGLGALLPQRWVPVIPAALWFGWLLLTSQQGTGGQLPRTPAVIVVLFAAAGVALTMFAQRQIAPARDPELRSSGPDRTMPSIDEALADVPELPAVVVDLDADEFEGHLDDDLLEPLEDDGDVRAVAGEDDGDEPDATASTEPEASVESDAPEESEEPEEPEASVESDASDESVESVESDAPEEGAVSHGDEDAAATADVDAPADEVERDVQAPVAGVPSDDEEDAASATDDDDAVQDAAPAADEPDDAAAPEQLSALEAAVARVQAAAGAAQPGEADEGGQAIEFDAIRLEDLDESDVQPEPPLPAQTHAARRGGGRTR